MTALVGTAIVACAGMACAQPLAPGALAACVQQRADEQGFSGVVSAVQRGRVLALVARGERAGPHSASITPDTRFNIGSASKMFTAVAVGQLVDTGLLSFDDPVGKYVFGLTPGASAVTVGQLLSHTSGLGDFFDPKNIAAMEQARSATDLLPLIADDRPAFTPGDHFQYSNSGFALLGILVERVSGEEYGRYLQRHVFAPAGMTQSGVDPHPPDSLAIGMTNMRPGMQSGPSAVAPAPPSLAVAGPLNPAPGATLYGTPAGGVFSTAVDMQKFTAALFDNRLTKLATTLALTTQKVTAGPNAAGRGYGYGFAIRLEHGRRWVGHNGGTLGVNAEIFVDPTSALSVTVLSNRDPPSATRMFESVVDLLADPADAAHCVRAP